MNAPTTTAPEHALAVSLPLDRNPAAVYLAHLAPGMGRRAMRDALSIMAGMLTGGEADALTCEWAALRFQHTAALRSRLAERYAPATVNRLLSALRGVLKAAWQLGLMTAEDCQRAGNVGRVRGETIPAGRELTSGEIAALMGACENDHTPAGARDATLIALLYACGLRRAEVVDLNMTDYDRATGRLVVRGKGQKKRIAWLSNGVLDAMTDWLTVRGSDPGPIFWPTRKNGTLAGNALTSTQTVYRALRKRAHEAGVRDFSPHDLRRTFVSDLLDAGADIATVAKMAGHANVQTTARYDRRTEEAKRRAAGLLHVPYRGRGLGV